MGILLDAGSRLIIQGITGHVGRNAAGRMREAGTPLVGGVTPGRGGQTVEGVPVFDSCYEAAAEVGATGSLVLVPAPFCMDACLEAIDAGLGLVSVYTDNVPLADAIRIRSCALARGTVVLGPNSAGTVTPGVANLSDLNDDFLAPGTVGIVAKSGAITYEVADLVRAEGLGVSSVVCLGGDPVLCTGYREVLERFRADPGTEAVVLIGEIGGGLELLAVDVIRDMGKPVVAHVLGRHAPPGKRMGHAGALVGRGDDARAKGARLGGAGAVVVERFWQLGEEVARALGKR
ncbi:MAG TPA: succinate--CoA ligase subunit alpha [Geminicoccaceae bacterium]|nr:succinate--CoA ligase subunit alpha [Geminicoccaceae bacterium]